MKTCWEILKEREMRAQKKRDIIISMENSGHSLLRSMKRRETKKRPVTQDNLELTQREKDTWVCFMLSFVMSSVVVGFFPRLDNENLDDYGNTFHDC